MSEEFNEENVTMADLEDHFDDANPWNVVQSYLEKGTVLPVKIEGIVNGGAIAMVEGIRGFIPASRLSLSYIEDLESYLLKDIEVQVIDVDQANNRLVLSARELLKEKEKKEREEKIANIKVGSVLTGTVESLQNYGAFVRLEDGLSGLVHVSQISQKRIKFPKDVLNVGDEVQVKVIGVKDGKISLSMKALEEDIQEEEEVKVEIPSEQALAIFSRTSNYKTFHLLVKLKKVHRTFLSYAWQQKRNIPVIFIIRRCSFFLISYYLYRRYFPASFSRFCIHNATHASLGILQSPLGDNATVPTFGPSGRQDLLNCCEKNLQQNVRSHL